MCVCVRRVIFLLLVVSRFSSRLVSFRFYFYSLCKYNKYLKLQLANTEKLQAKTKKKNKTNSCGGERDNNSSGRQQRSRARGVCFHSLFDIVCARGGECEWVCMCLCVHTRLCLCLSLLLFATSQQASFSSLQCCCTVVAFLVVLTLFKAWLICLWDSVATATNLGCTQSATSSSSSSRGKGSNGAAKSRFAIFNCARQSVKTARDLLHMPLYLYYVPVTPALALSSPPSLTLS